MSYAAAFNEIFARIFGLPRAKPRIRKHGRFWVCSTPDGRCGFGVHPRQAYGAWALLGRA